MDERRGVGQQESDQFGDVLRGAEPTGGVMYLDLLRRQLIAGGRAQAYGT